MARIGFSGRVSDRTPEFYSGDSTTVEFTLAHDAGPEGYDVFIEGIRQFAGQAYDIAGNKLTFTTAPPSGTANVMCIPSGRRIPLPTTASWRHDSFDGDGTTTQFTLGEDPGGLHNTLVEVGGVMQIPGAGQAYTITGSTLTFTEAPPSGTDNIVVRYTTVAAIGQASSLTTTAVSGLTEDTAPDAAADYVMTYDASAGALKKAKPENLGGGAWELVIPETVVSTAVGSVDFTTGIDSNYDQYRVVLTDVLPATDDVSLEVILRQSGTWRTDAGYWAGSAQTQWRYSNDTVGQGISNVAADGLNGTFELWNANTAGYPVTRAQLMFWRADDSRDQPAGNNGIYRGNTGAVDGIRFRMSSGNIASGTFRLYGLKKS